MYRNLMSLVGFTCLVLITARRLRHTPAADVQTPTPETETPA